MAEPLIPIIQQAFDFNVALYEYVNKFPRAHKALLGREMWHLALEFMVLLVTANHRMNKVSELEETHGFLSDRLRLSLNPQHTAVMPLTQGVDFLGYVIYPHGYKRVRRRNVVHVRRRLKKLEAEYARREIAFAHARGSIASWLGLAKHACAFRLSRGLFLEHDVRNIGKRLLVKAVSR